MIQIHPSELRGRVEPLIRSAIVAGTAEWMPGQGYERQGDLRKLLADRDRTWAVHRGFQHLSDAELKADLQMWEEQRKEPRYTRNSDWAEMVDDCIEDLRVELARRAQA